jgi:hypothetical protein
VAVSGAPSNLSLETSNGIRLIAALILPRLVFSPAHGR